MISRMAAWIVRIVRSVIAATFRRLAVARARYESYRRVAAAEEAEATAQRFVAASGFTRGACGMRVRLYLWPANEPTLEGIQKLLERDDVKQALAMNPLLARAMRRAARDVGYRSGGSSELEALFRESPRPRF